MKQEIDFKATTHQVIILKVSHKVLDWITTQSGFDWLYDYEFKSSRVLTIEAFMNNCDENPTEEFKRFCEKVNKTFADLFHRKRNVLPGNTLIMFEPADKI
jgi:hypothetical protein